MIASTIYSPGPWSGVVIEGKLAVSSRYETVCTNVKDHNAVDLIAAAPDMLEALREAQIALKHCSEFFQTFPQHGSALLPVSALKTVRDVLSKIDGNDFDVRR